MGFNSGFKGLMIITRSVVLRMRKVSDKRCRENLDTHLVLNNFFFFFENRAIYETIWKNIVEPDSP